MVAFTGYRDAGARAAAARITRAAAVAAALALAIASGAHGDPRSDAASPFAYGEQQFGLLAGGGFGLAIRPHLDVDHTRMFGLFPRWGIGLSDPLARGEFYEGNFELDLQPMVLLNYRPRDGWAAGGSFVLHYNFLRAQPIVPFIEAGAGMSDLQFRLQDESDGFTYPIEGTLGIHVPVSDHTALTASVGYYHLSNAGRELPNFGINAVMVRLGFTLSPASFAAVSR